MSNLVIPDGGNIGSASDTDAISIASNGQVTFSSNTLATQSEIFGTHTTGSITSGTTSLTVASGSGISNGDFVVGEGITPGTTVSSGGGTTSITLSANANATLSSDPVMFYSATKLLSPSLVGGMLCRAWVNFNGTGTVAIRASANVSSITDNSGNGNYTVNFTTAMPDANYSTNVSAKQDESGAGTYVFGSFYAGSGATVANVFDTDFVRVTCNIGNGTSLYDAVVMCVSVFR